jgi:enoyl-CoA hydratase/carnithine racemase
LVRAENSGRIARITLDRPDKKNAITAEMYVQLAEALAAADADTGTRVVLI